MKKFYSSALSIALALILLQTTAGAQSTYTWNVASGTWTTAGNWTPARNSPNNGDVLIFDGSTVATATATISASMTIGQLRIINGANVTFSITGASPNMTIGGAAGTDFIMDAGTTLAVTSTANNNDLDIQPQAGTTSSISGAITFGGTAFTQQHSLIGTTANSITFNSGGSLTTSTGFDGDPFGTGATMVIFASGSSYVHNTGNGPWGGGTTVTFQPGSTAVYRNLTGMEMEGHTHANVTLQNSIAFSDNPLFGGAWQMQSLTVEAGSSFSYAGGLFAGSITITGNISTEGAGNVSIGTSGGNVLFNSGGTQTIGGGGGSGSITFNGMVVSNNTSIVLNRNVTCNTNTASFASGSSINFGARVISGSANFTLSSGATLQTANNNGINSAGGTGSVTVSGTRSFSSGGTYILNGAASGVFTTNPTANTVGNLIIDNVAGVTLNQNTTVSGTLTLTNGILTIGNNNVILAAAGVLSGGSSTNYIRTNGTGTFRRSSVGATTVSFPVGNSAYNPVTISNTGVVDNFLVRVVDNVLTGGTSGTPLTGARVERTWIITETTNGGSNATITLQWNASEEGGTVDHNNVFLAHHTGLVWESMGIDPHNSPAAGGTDPYTATQAGIDGFSPFTIGTPGFTPLPVTLEDIYAINKGKTNEIGWKTAHEDEGDRMELERSTDGNVFTTIAGFAGQGSGSVYTHTDANPTTGVNYYRLKMIDVDNNATYSKVVTATVKGTSATVVLYPNPAGDHMKVLVNGNEGDIIITDMSGKVWHNASLANNGNTIDMSRMPAGVYFVKYTNKGYTEIQSIVKQ